MDIRQHNQEAWQREVEEGNIWTRPVSKEEVERARNKDFQLLLTPNKPVPHAWLTDVTNKDILCLASGGGQQGPLLAAAGARVTVFDNSPAQLANDQMVAKRDNLTLHTVEGDMRDLTCFADESFDLIFHPVSNCFVDDVKPVWKHCYRVLRRGGTLLAGFSNPLMYIFDFHAWDNQNQRIVRYKIPYSDLEQLPKEQLQQRIEAKETLEFGHSLEEQIGEQLRSGFLLAGFYEDTSHDDLLDPYISTFIATRAMKMP